MRLAIVRFAHPVGRGCLHKRRHEALRGRAALRRGLARGGERDEGLGLPVPQQRVGDRAVLRWLIGPRPVRKRLVA